MAAQHSCGVTHDGCAAKISTLLGGKMGLTLIIPIIVSLVMGVCLFLWGKYHPDYQVNSKEFEVFFAGPGPDFPARCRLRVVLE